MHKSNFYCLMSCCLYCCCERDNFWCLNWDTVAEALLIPGSPTVVTGGEATYHQPTVLQEDHRGLEIMSFVNLNQMWAGKRKESLVITSFSFAHQCLLPSSLWSTLENFVGVSSRSLVVFHQDTDKRKDIFCILFAV